MKDLAHDNEPLPEHLKELAIFFADNHRQKAEIIKKSFIRCRTYRQLREQLQKAFHSLGISKSLLHQITLEIIFSYFQQDNSSDDAVARQLEELKDAENI